MGMFVKNGGVMDMAECPIVISLGNELFERAGRIVFVLA